MPDKLLTTEEVAALLRIPPKSLYQWRRRGDGPKGRKLGVRILYREADVQAWIEDQFEDDQR